MDDVCKVFHFPLKSVDSKALEHIKFSWEDLGSSLNPAHPRLDEKVVYLVLFHLLLVEEKWDPYFIVCRMADKKKKIVMKRIHSRCIIEKWIHLCRRGTSDESPNIVPVAIICSVFISLEIKIFHLHSLKSMYFIHLI